MKRFAVTFCAKLLSISLFSILLFGNAQVVAQSTSLTNDFVFNQWTVNDGLPVNEISCIAQTQEDYMWLATFDGLVRFDGDQFVTFNSGNTSAFSTNRLASLLVDRDNNLWIVTERVGKEKALIKYRDGEFTAFGLKDGLIGDINVQLSSEGNLLLGSGNGAFFYDGKALKSFRDKLTGLSVRSILNDSEGTFWFSTMAGIVKFLYRQLFEDAQLALQLSQLQFPNIMALLDHLEKQLELNTIDAEGAMSICTNIEQLFANLKLDQGLSKTRELRKLFAQKLPEWNNARFIHQQYNVERLEDKGNLLQALKKADTLLQTCLRKGVEAYKDAGYDLAVAYLLIGSLKNACGQSEQGLIDCLEAKKLFEAFGEKELGMVGATMSKAADCLRNLGRLEESVRLYTEAIVIGESISDTRGTAVRKGQLGTIRYLQEKYDEAIEAYEEARVIFENFKEPLSVPTTWHQKGLAYYHKRDFASSEKAFQASLAIKTREGHLSGQASTLTMLAHLYDNGYNNPEQALVFYQQAATVYEGLDNKKDASIVYNNMAHTLLNINRLEDALKAAKRAEALRKDLGLESEPWKTQSLLNEIETALGHEREAEEAWLQARNLYLAYRRQGAGPQNKRAQFADHLITAVQGQQSSALIQELQELLASSEVPTAFQQFTQALIQILQGTRDRSLADDMELHYDAAAEILFFIERLEQLQQDGKLMK